ncbi:hypothetical protein MVEN_00374600 [Mycena venus]|uniref:Uncharacterized protein n=1 Tax=Mycena venus TaxID=2733690 RepID=A0A8H7D8A1_9AGAR|nr:hypothetical protein MVEN_00374600 [Mycena venus]
MAVLAAIGHPETMTRGYLFAVMRLSVHHKNYDKSLIFLCTIWISKESFWEEPGLKELTMNHGTDRPAKRRRVGDALVAPVFTTFRPTENQVESLHFALDSTTLDLADYASPDNWRTLPFPFIYHSLPHHRFKFQSVKDGDGEHLFATFDWMRRETFPLLVDAFNSLTLNGTGPFSAFLLGPLGVGKSHLLAVLAIFLRRQARDQIMDGRSGQIPTFSVEELARFNDYVGRAFLFYPPPLKHPDLAFSDIWSQIHQDPFFTATRYDIRQFTVSITTKNNERVRENYFAGVRAFLTCRTTDGISADLIDHQHCFVDEVDHRSRVTSSLARRELLKILGHHKENNENLPSSIDLWELEIPSTLRQL